MKKIILLTGLILLTSLACNLPVMSQVSPPVPRDAAPVIITPDPRATATPTPFQPLEVTPPSTSPFPTATQGSPEEEPTATPTEEDQPVPRIDIPDGVVSIMIFGSDWRPGRGSRTDVILLLILNPATGGASLVSFPRDLYVFIPGVGQERINTAQAYGDFPLTQQTFQINFGFTPDHYIMTYFDAFISIVDSLGGINVEASRNLTDTCKLPQAVEGYCSVGPGTVWMNGETALWYVRSRYSTNDFDRTRRAQEVIIAIFKKLMSLDAITRAPDLYRQFRNSVDTDIDLDTAVSLARIAPGLISNPEKIRRYSVGPDQVWPYVTERGAQVLIPNTEAIQAILNEAFRP
jgi:LCP family protein required for cell wall assembly